MNNLRPPARDRILLYLRQNRGREIPVSELATQLDLKRTTISNAIKELNLQEYITVERRPLKRGRYTVIYLTGDLIKDKYIHKNEIINENEESKEEKKTPTLSVFNIDETIHYLKSPHYKPEDYIAKINSLFPDSFPFIVDFITPLMHEVGVQWARTSISTADEHVISNRVEYILLSRIPTKRGNGGKGLVMLLPVEGERHVISLLCLEYLLQNLNYSVINLGRALPIRSFIQYIKDLPTLPDWIFMSITLPAYLGTIKRNLEYLKNAFQDRIRIAIGGQGISEKERNDFPEADVIVIGSEDLREFIKNL